MKKIIYFTLLICLFSCGKGVDDLKKDKLFTNIPSSISGITFENRVLESEQLHYYKYLYIYIGGGVAAADFNNDGLQDLFFTSNIYSNKLFLNRGNFEFEDITLSAGIEKRVGFDAGVSVADVNNDGFLDIYINRAGWYTGNERLANMLYINNGDLTFTEKASEYGLADTNRSISSTFFDYDKDGDLDLYITNAPTDFSLSGKLLDLERIKSQKEKIRNSKSSDKLYRNNGNGSFSDVSEAADIALDLGFGLHAQICDLNNDSWPDIFVCNDFIMPDFAYINNGDGTFTDKRDTLFKHISYYSMGADFADINNDGFQDLMVTEMSPEDHVRSKTTMSMMSINRFNAMTNNGYHYQYMHNVLQLNNGNGSFSEISNLSNVVKTDWSWATLFADFDLDGYNDLFVTNGVYRDVVDRDTNNEINEYINANKATLTEIDYYKFTQKLPQQKLKNYLFKNDGDLKFSNVTEDWADLKTTFSNGAVYVDLDNDGDLDIVTNNLDEEATVLKNNSRELHNGNYLQLTFKGPEKNPFGVGVKVKVFKSDNSILTRELVNSRGYMSSISNKLHFGLGQQKKIDSLKIIWPDGMQEVIYNIASNQTININYNRASNSKIKPFRNEKLLFTELPFDFLHTEKIVDDFNIQLLLPHKLSQIGPAIAKSDLNNDDVDDIFIGGAHGFEGQILFSGENGSYNRIVVNDFLNDKLFEDISACFFDADNDGDDDLYVVSGSYEFEAGSELLQDRLYINNGNSFIKSKTKLPIISSAGAIVKASDYDNDGDIDLFVGGRVISGKYPYAPKSYLLINEGGKFIDKTLELANELSNIGMVTTAQWVDIDADADKDLDLVVSGEWMGIEVLINNSGNLIKDENYSSLSSQTGWWNKIIVEDIDHDGDLDIIAGNLGLNYKFHASKNKPFHIYTNDFDKNGTQDIVLAKYNKEKLVPVRGKSCTAQQMPYLRKKIKTYQEFARSNIEEIIGDSFQSAIHLQTVEFRSGYFLNNNNQFEFTPFTIEAQISPINSIIYDDFNRDGIKDLVLAGNNYMSEIETTRADAGIGVFLKGNKEVGFSYVENRVTGFYADKDVRNMVQLKLKEQKGILVINNNSKHQLYLNKY